MDYTKPDWQKEVLKITKGHGVDIVFDPVGMIKGSRYSINQLKVAETLPSQQIVSNASLGREEPW